MSAEALAALARQEAAEEALASVLAETREAHDLVTRRRVTTQAAIRSLPSYTTENGMLEHVVLGGRLWSRVVHNPNGSPDLPHFTPREGEMWTDRDIIAIADLLRAGGVA